MIALSSNLKTGYAFDLAEGTTCPGKTDVCVTLCYPKIPPMGWHFGKRLERFKEVAHVLATKGIQKLGKQFAVMCHNACLESGIDAIRLHGAGDFFSVAYIKAWIVAAKLLKKENIKLWAYTRSYRVPQLIPALKELDKQKNVSIWLSADAECWMQCLAVFEEHKFSGIAIMQHEDEDAPWFQGLVSKVPTEKLVIFPAHKRNNNILVNMSTDAAVCPTFKNPHEGKMSKKPKDAPCLECRKCLPGG